jgi:hypothetical protein
MNNKVMAHPNDWPTCGKCDIIKGTRVCEEIAFLLVFAVGQVDA